MITLRAVLSGFLCVSAFAATSPSLHWQGQINTPSIPIEGTPGNVAWDSTQFVSAVAKTNGRIHIVKLDTVGSPSSDVWTGVTGSSPRVAFGGTNVLLAWFDTNSVPASLLTAPLIGSTTGVASLVGVAAVPGTLTLRAAEGKFLAVWENDNAAVLARWLSADGASVGASFAVAPGALPQRHPSINSEGTNYLVAWMEQISAGTNWCVMTRFIDTNGPVGMPSLVSRTNVLKPRATACSFGTNYLVAWSADEGPYTLCGVYEGDPCPNGTNLWFAMVYGRMVDRTGAPAGDTLQLIRARGAHTNVVIAYGDGFFVVTAATGWEHAPALFPLPLRYPSPGARCVTVDGRMLPTMPTRQWTSERPPSLAFGGGRFCLLQRIDDGARVAHYGRSTIEDPMVAVSLVASNRVDVTPRSGSDFVVIEASTNMVDWFRPDRSPPDYKFAATNAFLFFRSTDHRWTCSGNLRAIQGAKQQWGLDFRKRDYDVPMESDLFGPGRYLINAPVCPNYGAYSINELDSRPMCNVSGHWVD